MTVQPQPTTGQAQSAILVQTWLRNQKRNLNGNIKKNGLKVMWVINMALCVLPAPFKTS